MVGLSSAEKSERENITFSPGTLHDGKTSARKAAGDVAKSNNHFLISLETLMQGAALKDSREPCVAVVTNLPFHSAPEEAGFIYDRRPQNFFRNAASGEWPH